MTFLTSDSDILPELLPRSSVIEHDVASSFAHLLLIYRVMLGVKRGSLHSRAFLSLAAGNLLANKYLTSARLLTWLSTCGDFSLIFTIKGAGLVVELSLGNAVQIMCNAKLGGGGVSFPLQSSLGWIIPRFSSHVYSGLFDLLNLQPSGVHHCSFKQCIYLPGHTMINAKPQLR